MVNYKLIEERNELADRIEGLRTYLLNNTGDQELIKITRKDLGTTTARYNKILEEIRNQKKEDSSKKVIIRLIKKTN